MKTTKTKGFCRFRNSLGISKKRGIIELQFNWIFVLIAGAIIFVFFINIVNKQREFSEVRTSGTIITNLDSILTGAQVSTNTVNIIEMPKVDINFECDKYFIGSSPKQTKGNVIFAPDLLKGKKVITWALDWNMPYRVTNFLYITDPELRYIIVNNSKNLGKVIFDELPEEMNKELVHPNELGDLKDKNNYKVKFIFLGDINNNGLTNLGKMQDKDITGIQIVGINNENVLPSTGTIKFLQKKGDFWDQRTETFYLKKESLYGAIFAADKEMYDCVMKKAFTKLNLLTQIYLARSTRLSDYYGIDNANCANAHYQAKVQLEYIKDSSQLRITDFPATNGINNMIAMRDFNTHIKDENQRAQLFSCALIY